MATRRTSRQPRPFRWTRSHLARLPQDGNRYEVLDGALLVTPQAGPGHQHIALELAATLLAYCRAYGLGTVFASGAVVFDQNELQPDVQVIPVTAAEARDGTWKAFPTSRLVLEIISPGSDRIDRGKKREAYLRLGIPEYWVIDIEARHVEVFTPGREQPRIEIATLTWRPDPARTPLIVDLTALFGR